MPKLLLATVDGVNLSNLELGAPLYISGSITVNDDWDLGKLFYPSENSENTKPQSQMILYLNYIYMI